MGLMHFVLQNLHGITYVHVSGEINNATARLVTTDMGIDAVRIPVATWFSSSSYTSWLAMSSSQYCFHANGDKNQRHGSLCKAKGWLYTHGDNTQLVGCTERLHCLLLHMYIQRFAGWLAATKMHTCAHFWWDFE